MVKYQGCQLLSFSLNNYKIGLPTFHLKTGHNVTAMGGRTSSEIVIAIDAMLKPDTPELDSPVQN